LEPKSPRRRGRRTWISISIYVSGKVSPSTMYMMREVHKNSSMKIQRSKVLFQSWRVTMQQYWLMDRQELERLIPWRVLNTILETHREVLFQDQWKKSLSSFRCSRARIQPLWSVLVIYRFTTRLSQISSRSKELRCRSEKTRKKEFLLKVSANGLLDHLMKSML
jgi:hypothetical protein